MEIIEHRCPPALLTRGARGAVLALAFHLDGNEVKRVLCSQWRTQKFRKMGGEASEGVAPPGYGKGGTTGGLRAKPPAANEFLRFSHEKTLILAHFFIEKENAVRAVTIVNAKIFSQLTFKSRSLAKISEKRLQPLLVCEIIH